MVNLPNLLSNFGVLEVPFAFSIVERGRWFFSSNNERPFATTAIILPVNVGTARAVFSALSEEVDRRPQVRGPFESGRVQSSVSWRGIRERTRTNTWLASPSEGWRIDLETIDYTFDLLNSGCSNSRSRASWTGQTEQVIRITATTSSDRRAGATCRTATTIRFEEWQSTMNEVDLISDEVQVLSSQTVRLALADTPEISRARLSHIEVSSPLYGEGVRIYRIDDLPDGITARYDAASQSVYLTIGYR